MNSYKYIDLFAGAGGLSLGFGDNDFHLQFANDFGKEEVETFKSNLKKTHPDTPQDNIISGEIRKLSIFLSRDDLDVYQFDSIMEEININLDQKESLYDFNYEKIKNFSIYRWMLLAQMP